MDVTELRPLDGADEAYVHAGAGRARRLRPAAQRQPPGDHRRLPGRRGAGACTAGAAVLLGPQVQRRRLHRGRTASASTWLLGAPDVLLPAGDPALAEIDAPQRAGPAGPAAGPAPRRAGRPRTSPRGAEPAALVVLEQRLRPDAAETLRYFADQDVDAKVISGDNAVSVGAVAGKLGLPGAEHPGGRPPAARRRRTRWRRRSSEDAVFGRVTPQQKRDMVGALQSRGHTVAMTGDGVNDVLALKDADIGVAMGSGSEATRAVAQIVLLEQQLRDAAVGRRRGPPGHRQHHPGRHPVPDEDRLLGAAGDPGGLLRRCEYPFLPRHLTLLSTLTIGVPAFFLALAPNKERARPHFVRRVMRYAVPSGVIAGGGHLRHVPAGPAPLHRPGRPGRRDQRGDPDAVPGRHVGPGDHRPPVHLVAGRPGRGDGPGLPASCWSCRGSRTSSR